MSSGIKLTIVALVAFALGFAGARLFPEADDPSPAENLAWERVGGGSVRLTAKSPGSGYLILQKNTDQTRSAVRGPSRPFWSVERAMNLKTPVILYELQPLLVCPNGQRCNRCRIQGKDCPPPPGPPPFSEALQVPAPIDVEVTVLGWLPMLDRTEPGIPDLPSDR